MVVVHVEEVGDQLATILTAAVCRARRAFALRWRRSIAVEPRLESAVLVPRSRFGFGTQGRHDAMPSARHHAGLEILKGDRGSYHAAGRKSNRVSDLIQEAVRSAGYNRRTGRLSAAHVPAVAWPCSVSDFGGRVSLAGGRARLVSHPGRGVTQIFGNFVGSVFGDGRSALRFSLIGRGRGVGSNPGSTNAHTPTGAPDG